MKAKKNYWRQTRDRLDKQFDVLRDKYNANQDVCPHENLVYSREGSSGNWDRSEDSYWFHFLCDDCNKNWTAPQTYEELQKYPYARLVKNVRERT